MERRGKVNELLREYLFAISSEAPSTSLVQRGFFLEKGRMKRELTERKLTISKKNGIGALPIPHCEVEVKVSFTKRLFPLLRKNAERKL